MLGSIKYNLSNLMNWKGRDARQTFWFYVLFLFIVQYAVGMLISMPMMGGLVRGAFTAAQQGASDAEMQARMMAQMAGYMRTSITLTSIVAIIAALLLTASFVRRLHDSDRPGWIAALAVILFVGSKVLLWTKMDEIVNAMTRTQPQDIAAIMGIQSKLVSSSVLSWAAIIIVLAFGVWPSTQGPNRHGAEQVRI